MHSVINKHISLRLPSLSHRFFLFSGFFLFFFSFSFSYYSFSGSGVEEIRWGLGKRGVGVGVRGR